MKRIFPAFFALACLFILILPACGENMKENKVKMIFGDEEMVVRLNDSPASRELLSLLPLTLDFKDYAGEEKISYLPRKLDTGGTSEKGSGDFAYYAPWGNLAVFYNKTPSGGRGLYILGVIESGRDRLALMKDNFTARLERAE